MRNFASNANNQITINKHNLTAKQTNNHQQYENKTNYQHKAQNKTNSSNQLFIIEACNLTKPVTKQTNQTKRKHQPKQRINYNTNTTQTSPKNANTQHFKVTQSAI